MIVSELARLESKQVNYASNAAPIQELDRFFQQAFAEVWP